VLLQVVIATGQTSNTRTCCRGHSASANKLLRMSCSDLILFVGAVVR
jgi:hypothetical protein